jgi:tetratricopeptide (TPR) repeat protein
LYSYKNLPKLHRITTPTGYMAQLDRQARLVTVRIENEVGNGSGVIVAREGNSYYVLTAEHVVKNIQALRVTTHEQRTYKINPSDIKRAAGTDLAVVKFTSTQPYQVATLGNYLVSDYSLVFSAGWPAPTKINSQQWQWQLNPGEIKDKQQGEFQSQDKHSFSQAYDLLHNSITYGGMSGGPIFDSLGRVIGIHGKAEGDGASGNILGNSVGISTQTFLSFAQKLKVNQRSLKVSTNIPVVLDSKKLASINLVRTNIPIPNNASGAEQWIEYGNQLYRLGEYPKAVTAFDRAIALQPNSLYAYHGKGLSLSYKSGLPAALIAYDKAIALVPSDDRSKFYYLWKYRSKVLKGLGDFKEALTAISEAIRLEPEDMIIVNEKASLLSELGDEEGAIGICNLIVTKGEKDWAYQNRGISKSKLEDKKGAMSDFDAAIRVNSQNAQAYYNRGVTRSELGDRKGAIADYDTAIRINPQYADAYNNRGIAESELYKKGEIAKYDAAIRINPQDANAYAIRGAAKSALGDYKGAIADLDAAIRINPQLVAAYFDRDNAALELELDDKKDAIAKYGAAIRINPQDAEAYSNRGVARSASGNKKGAIYDFDAAIRINPQYADAYNSRGNSKSALGDKKGAIADFDAAIRINPQLVKAYNNRGVDKHELGDTRGAISDFDAAIRIKPQNDNAYYNRGIAKSALGDKKGALADLNIAAQLSKTQNNQDLYDQVMNLISKLSN